MQVAVLDDYQNVALELADWSQIDAKTTVFNGPIGDNDAVVAALSGFDVIVCMRERTAFPASVIERLDNLKLLITTGMRNASIDMAAAKARNIVVCGTQGAGSPTSELAWALILGLMKNIPSDDRSMRNGEWQPNLGFDVMGKTLGMLGLGRLGGEVAKVGLAFGMNVIAWSSNLTDERAAEAGARRVEKDELFAQADVLSIHLILGDRSRGLVGARELGLMKPTSFLVNTSRGPIVDEAALIDTLKNKRIAGAGIDVYDVEPLPADHPIRSLENTLLTPHMGYVTRENFTGWYNQAIENIQGFVSGAPVRVIS
ncbi:MAG: D-2-hydroxyacid dehydrogenase family protein [Alphaproteobacteria bacterium]|jgi:phosphoglycerate dehydrogenase-like enzyme